VIVVVGEAVGVPGDGNALTVPLASKSAGRGVGSGTAVAFPFGWVVVVEVLAPTAAGLVTIPSRQKQASSATAG
jgi:hypothetical protein